MFVGFPVSPPDDSIPVQGEENYKCPHESLANDVWAGAPLH